MPDISKIIAPKSDQLNADDLATGERTIHIRDVHVSGAGREQPISVFFEGDDNKPWKPCKTMARLLANLWQAPDTSQWVGRSVTLYRDPDVKWAGAKVGGIRIRAVSHIDAPRQVAITESKQARKLATIGVIKAEVRQMPQPDDVAAKWAAQFIGNVRAATSADAVNALRDSKQARLAELQTKRPDLHTKVSDAIAEMLDSFGEKRADEQHGDQFSGDDLDFGDDE